MYERTMRINYLYDFYASLLTERQKEILKMYYLEDLSLGEIAAEIKISRQGVYDLLHRGVKQLEKFEEKLELYKKFKERQLDFDEALSIIDKVPLDETTRSNFLRLLSRLHYQD